MSDRFFWLLVILVGAALLGVLPDMMMGMFVFFIIGAAWLLNAFVRVTLDAERAERAEREQQQEGWQ